MRPLLAAIVFVAMLLGQAAAQTGAAQTKRAAVPYGRSPAAGRTFTHDGVKLYYEIYVVAEPLLLVHGNGGSIADLAAEIEHFRKRYRVIAMDSRDQGESAETPERSPTRR
jgi:pimeloyl-ACP methyl ester carboxylesterase